MGVDDLRPLQARMTFTMARQVVVEMSRSFDVSPSHYEGGDRLTPEDYASMEADFEAAGLDWTKGEVARETLAALRATYEPLLDGLAKHLLLPIPGWVAHDDAIDHWERGHRGTIARRLLEELSDRNATLPDRPEAGTGWRKLRARLKSD